MVAAECEFVRVGTTGMLSEAGGAGRSVPKPRAAYTRAAVCGAWWRVGALEQQGVGCMTDCLWMAASRWTSARFSQPIWSRGGMPVTSYSTSGTRGAGAMFSCTIPPARASTPAATPSSGAATAALVAGFSPAADMVPVCFVV